jgi:hypothetical protein
MSCVERDDAPFLCKYIAFPLMLVVYAGALAHTVKKLRVAVAAYDSLCICLFVINCLFFTTRCVYWLDFVGNYPKNIFNFLNYWPHIVETTAALALGVSWLLICKNFESSFNADSKGTIRTAIVIGCLGNFSYITGYFIVDSLYGCKIADVLSRLYIVLSMAVVWVFVGTYGFKLMRLIEINLDLQSTKKINQIFVLASVCFAMRIVINIVMIVAEAQMLWLMEYSQGAVYAIFIVADYSFTEILFMYGVTTTLSSNGERLNSYVSSIAAPLQDGDSTESSQIKG